MIKHVTWGGEGVLKSAEKVSRIIWMAPKTVEERGAKYLEIKYGGLDTAEY